MGYLLLEGGAEFGGQMRVPDLKAIELAGGFNAPVRILPAAAAPDNNHIRAGNNGVRWFQSLGARNVESVPLIDKTSANNPEVTEALRHAKLIFLLGGFTHYLGRTLKDTSGWEAALAAYQNGAVIVGSSAGAMVMCEFYYDPDAGKVVEGLNLVPNALVLPHHNTFGKGWANRLLAQLPGVTLLGIDERTGMRDSGSGGEWSVMGQGGVTIYRQGQREIHPTGETFSLK